MPELDELKRDPLLTEREAAEALQTSIHVLRRERAAGRLSYLKVGRAVMYRESHLAQYLKDQEQPAIASPSAPDKKAGRRRRAAPSTEGQSPSEQGAAAARRLMNG